ncbi:MAG: hypothetical protein NVS3B18_02930 [Candidatus Dormibacteria bacterium]
MFGRSKSQTVLERVSSTGGAVTELASSARDAAAPLVRGAAASASDKLGDAAERAAALLADAAERLADAVPDGRLTDASQGVADSVRPHKGRSKVKTLLVVAATAGGVVAFLRSPHARQLRQRVFGAPDDDFDDEAESITLPVESQSSGTTPSATPPAAAAGLGGDVPDVAGVTSPTANGSQASSPKKSSTPAPKPGEGG